MPFSKVEPLPVIGKKVRGKTAYLHKPPTIAPHYPKGNKSVLPKTKLSRVLLYDNTMQESMLDVQTKYINDQMRRFRSSYNKNRYAFIDLLKHRRKWHESWDIGYQRMKDAFVARFGTDHMPVPVEEPPEVDPFFINARLAPPLNILCFYLDAQKEDTHANSTTKKTSYKTSKNEPHRPKLTKSSLIKECLYDHERLMSKLDDCALYLYTKSVEDPRFRNLEISLVPPKFETDGYLQLSPMYSKHASRARHPVGIRFRAKALPHLFVPRKGKSSVGTEHKEDTESVCSISTSSSYSSG
ncbi:hypothetical protein DPMN_007681 [Dreissena polymorpha]|uniref:Uncharacterized protein n=1 Tax=Dreissena polymorpha TaxID=45954 RepID=A0A9D4MUR7_DREPO|nr:hypothetical protein DPMN_007681 [Dreissena polymorpha]